MKNKNFSSVSQVLAGGIFTLPAMQVRGIPLVSLHAIFAVASVYYNNLCNYLSFLPVFPVCKSSPIIHLPFQYSPESFHRTIINTVCHSGHALFHMVLFQTVAKRWACILKSSIRMKKRMRIGSENTASSNVSITRALSLRLLILNATILRSHRSRIALR